LLDILRLYQDYNIQYWTDGKNCAPGWIQVQCCFCGDSSNHLGYNLAKGYFTCWKCGKKKIEQVLMNLLSLEFYEVKKVMLEYAGYSKLFRKNEEKQKKVIPELALPGGELVDMHINYLSKRNFDADYLVNKYGITGTGITGDWKFRIMIPVIYNRKMVAFQGRDITGKAKYRYKSLSIENSIMPVKEVIYNIDNCNSDSVIVLEGITDVWRMGDNTCATFGTSVTSKQIKLLSRYKKIFFLFDPEIEAQERARFAASKLSSLGCNVEIVDLGIDGDPATLNAEEVDNIKKELFS
jgi:DNA primase